MRRNALIKGEGRQIKYIFSLYGLGPKVSFKWLAGSCWAVTALWHGELWRASLFHCLFFRQAPSLQHLFWGLQVCLGKGGEGKALPSQFVILLSRGFLCCLNHMVARATLWDGGGTKECYTKPFCYEMPLCLWGGAVIFPFTPKLAFWGFERIVKIYILPQWGLLLLSSRVNGTGGTLKTHSFYGLANWFGQWTLDFRNKPLKGRFASRIWALVPQEEAGRLLNVALFIAALL